MCMNMHVNLIIKQPNSQIARNDKTALEFESTIIKQYNGSNSQI